MQINQIKIKNKIDNKNIRMELNEIQLIVNIVKYHIMQKSQVLLWE